MTNLSLSSRRPTASTIFLAVLAIAVVVLLMLVPEAALAQGGGNDVGRNLGDFLRDQAGPIYGGIIAIVSIIFLLNRRYSELGMFVLAAFVVGWLVFSPDSVANTARDIAREIFG